MGKNLLTAAALLFSGASVDQASPPIHSDGGSELNSLLSVSAAELQWQATQRDEISTAWEATEYMTNAITGDVTTRPHRYVEIGSGLNYFHEETGGYISSEDSIELSADGGAAAIRGPAKLFLKPNLNSAEAVKIVTAKGRQFTTRPVGIFWYDAKSGASQLVAGVHDCVGELLPPNQVVWKEAFGSLADLRITYTKSAIESDLILLREPPLPVGWDASTARLEVWHEWTVPAEPVVTARLLRGESDVQLRSVMTEPDLTDQMLDFGDLWFPTGAAFLTEGAEEMVQGEPRRVVVRALSPGMEPVAKTWLTSAGKTILVETVQWASVQPQIAGLRRADSLANVQAASRLESLNLLPKASPASAAFGRINTAISEYRPTGFVFDYITVPSSYTSAYSFNTSTTYFVNSTTYFSGSVTFQPGCIIKFNGNYLLIYGSGSITCNGTSGNPSILTDYRENLWGEVLNSSGCPTPSASPALWDYYLNANLGIKNMRFRFAQTAIRFDSGFCSYTHNVSGCTFEECQTGIVGNNCYVTISSSTGSAVNTPTVGITCGAFTGSLTDIGNTDSDGNHLLDSQDYKYFGRLGTLPGNAAGQLVWRTAGRSPSTDQPIWSVRNDATSTYVYNTSCWLYGVAGLTACSPWNSWHDVQGAGTLITPRHAVVADHHHPPPTSTVRFVGSDNLSYSRAVLGYSRITPSSDYGIIVLSSDLPASVGFVRIFPAEALQKLTGSQMNAAGISCLSSRLPVIGFNQRKEGFIYDVGAFYPFDAYINGVSSIWFPNWGAYCRRFGTCDCAGADLMVGDSGHPTFLLLNNELILVGPWWACNAISSWQGNYLSNLNQTIINLDNAAFGAWTGYSATPYPITGFPSLW